MPPRVHRAPFVPKPIGLTYLKIDSQGRTVIPTDLRDGFGARQAPFDVVFTLAGKGYATLQALDVWPPDTERKEITRVLNLFGAAKLGSLSSAQLKLSQDFSRLVACRYLDGQVTRKWQVTIPEIVRAWLGASTRNMRMPRTTRSQQAKSTPPSNNRILFIGTLGGIELWSDEAIKESLPLQLLDFAKLRAEAAEALL